jgi:hypothetical protein
MPAYAEKFVESSGSSSWAGGSAMAESYLTMTYDYEAITVAEFGKLWWAKRLQGEENRFTGALPAKRRLPRGWGCTATIRRPSSM